MRLDRFLARWFHDRSRTEMTRYIRWGWVTDEQDKNLRPSMILQEGQKLMLYVPGIAPEGPPPPLPPILHEDEHVIVLNKPAGLPVHPGGTSFTWAVIGLAREHWPECRIDLVHRLDRDTSGVLVLTKDLDSNRFLKRETGDGIKEYEALCRGHIPWDHAELVGPIGAAGGVIRIQMGVRPDGQPAHTEVEVLGRSEQGVDPQLTRVRCRIRTGRTHQIRVHLADAGYGIVGDRMYGVGPEVFLRSLEDRSDVRVALAAGAPRQALHASRIAWPHPTGGTLEVGAPLPSDMVRWWVDPSATVRDILDTRRGGEDAVGMVGDLFADGGGVHSRSRSGR